MDHPNLKKTFAMFDTNSDGFIDAGELTAMLTTLGQDVTEAQVKDMLVEVSSGDSGISLADFLKMMDAREDGDAERDIQRAFDVADKDQDGFITDGELGVLLQALGYPLSESEISDLIQDCDKDGDGKLNFEDFKAMLA